MIRISIPTMSCSLRLPVVTLWPKKSITMFSNVIARKLFIRNSCAEDMDFVTKQSVMEKRRVGPYDFPNAFAFDPRRFFAAEVDKKVVGHICGITYPNHHSHMGYCIVAEEHRGNKYGEQLYNACYASCDKHYTIGADVRLNSKSELWIEASGGFEVYWDTYVAMLSPDKVIKKLSDSGPLIVTVKPSNMVTLSSILNYDTFVFGAPRHALIKRWITTPGSFGLVALRDHNNIVGYTILRQVIRNGGTEIGMAMSPLYADNVHIAKALIKAAAEKCLANEAVPNTKLELFHPVGKICGEDSSELMEELEADLTQAACRMYSKGIPPKRKIKKIYGILTPTFD